MYLHVEVDGQLTYKLH